MLEKIQGDHGAHGIILDWQVLDIPNDVNALSLAHIKPLVFMVWKQGADVGVGFLPRHLIGAYFKHGVRQTEGLGNGLRNPVKELIHLITPD
jgi:hypothetical protein